MESDNNEPHPVHCITQIENVVEHHHHHHHHHGNRPRSSSVHSHKDYVHLEDPAMLLEPTVGDLSVLTGMQPRRRHQHDQGEMKDIRVDRKIMSLPDFDRIHEPDSPKKTAKMLCLSLLARLACSQRTAKKQAMKMIPAVKVVRSYDFKNWLLVDVICGLTIGIITIPQSLGYALLADVPPVYGLYSSFLPVLLYCIFGTSRNMCYGTLSITYLLVGSAVVQISSQIQSATSSASSSTNAATTAPLTTNSVSGGPISSTSSMSASASTTTSLSSSVNDDLLRANIAICLGFFMGVIQLLIGVCRLGFITVYFADSMVAGYTTATIIYVLTSQLSSIFGLSIARQIGYFNLIKTWVLVFGNIVSTNIATLIVSIISITVLSVFKFWINPLVMKKIRAPVPIELILIVFGIVASTQLQLNKVYGVPIVGAIPEGLPAPSLPDFSLSSQLIGSAVVLSLVNFAVSVSLAQVLAKKHGYEIDDNQEAIAYGVCNLVSSFFSSLPSGGAVSRTCVEESIKGKSQLVGLICAIITLIVIYTIAGLCSSLPKCVLASIIIVGLSGMIDQFKHVKILWKVSKFDCAIWVVSFAATVILDTDIGLVISILFSFLVVVVRTQTTKRSLLGNIPDTELYEDVKRYKNAEQKEQIKVFRFAGPINFACSSIFRSALYKKTGANPRKLLVDRNKMERKKKRAMKKLKVEQDPEMCTKLREIINREEPTYSVKFVVIEMSACSYVDYGGLRILKQVIHEYNNIGIIVFIAACTANVKAVLKRTDFYTLNDASIVYLSVHDAVTAAQFQLKNGTLKASRTSCCCEEETQTTSSAAEVQSERTTETDEQTAKDQSSNGKDKASGAGIVSPVFVVSDEQQNEA